MNTKYVTSKKGWGKEWSWEKCDGEEDFVSLQVKMMKEEGFRFLSFPRKKSLQELSPFQYFSLHISLSHTPLLLLQAYFSRKEVLSIHDSPIHSLFSFLEWGSSNFPSILSLPFRSKFFPSKECIDSNHVQSLWKNQKRRRREDVSSSILFLSFSELSFIIIPLPSHHSSSFSFLLFLSMWQKTRSSIFISILPFSSSFSPEIPGNNIPPYSPSRLGEILPNHKFFMLAALVLFEIKDQIFWWISEHLTVVEQLIEISRKLFPSYYFFYYL